MQATFSASVAGATGYQWSFGDGGTSVQPNPDHFYNAHGSYTVSLSVTESGGCTLTKTKADYVNVLPVSIRAFNDLPFHGCAPHTQRFDADISSPEPITSYLWSFGDGQTSTEKNPVHSYTTAGSYTVSLIVKTANGCSDTLEYAAAIVTGIKPTAAFTADLHSACAYQNVNFTDKSTGSPNNWYWQFGDNFTSYAANPMHAYRDTGFFKVTLRVGNYYCYDTLQISDYVYIKPPVARFDVAYTCDTPYVRSFTDRSLAPQTFAWKFGDGTTSTEQSPQHTYPAPGTYNASLHVTNGSCYDDVFYIVQIIDEKPDFTIDNTVTCRNTISSFTVTNINEANIANYNWKFSDSAQRVTTKNSQITYAYNVSGVYSPALTIIDKLGCERKVNKPLLTTVNGPTAAFSNVEGTCINKAGFFY